MSEALWGHPNLDNEGWKLKKNKQLSLSRLFASPWAVCGLDRWRTSSSFPSCPSVPSLGPAASCCRWCSPPRRLGTVRGFLLDSNTPTHLISKGRTATGSRWVSLFALLVLKLWRTSAGLPVPDTETLLSDVGVLIEVEAAGFILRAYANASF